MTRADSGMPLTAESRVQIRTNLCGVCGGKISTGTDFFSEYFCFPLSASFCQFFILIFILFILLIEGKFGRMLGYFKPNSAGLVIGGHWMRPFFHVAFY